MNWLKRIICSIGSKIQRRTVEPVAVEDASSARPFRHLVIHNFLGKLRAELYLQSKPSQIAEIGFSFGLPKSGWSQIEIGFVGVGHFVCVVSDIPNDFYGDLAKAVVERNCSFSVAAHVEPDTIAFYVVDSLLYLCKFDSYESYESTRANHNKMLEHAFISVGYSRDYVLKCLRNLAKEWPAETVGHWAHEFPHTLLALA